MAMDTPRRVCLPKNPPTNFTSGRSNQNSGESTQIFKNWTPLAVLCVLCALTVVPVSGELATSVVTLQSSNTKAKWIDAIAADFNNSNFLTSTGKAAKIVVYDTNSPLDTNLQPTLWSPGDPSWISQALTQNNTPSVSSFATQCASTTAIPSGVAMWSKLASFLGWPNKPISLRALTDLASNPLGWASIDPLLAGYGQFKLGHGNPESSNTGRLFFLAAIYATANGSASILGGTNVTTDKVRKGMTAIESHVFHYGRQDLDLFDRMLKRGPSYLHAVATAESTMISYNTDPKNKDAFKRWGDKLVFIYPSDGTFWQPHPICVLDIAPWSGTPKDKELQEVAKLFSTYATAPEQQAKAAIYGVRPFVDSAAALLSPSSNITIVNGADPNVSRETGIPSLAFPTVPIAIQAANLFKEVKRPASVALVIDTSGSMGDFGNGGITKLQAAQQAAGYFIGNMSANDRLYAVQFSDSSLPIGKAGRVGDVRSSVAQGLNFLLAQGNTALYSTMTKALLYLKDQSAADINATVTVPGAEVQSPYNYALVVMTDGQDNVKTADSLAALNAQVPSGESPSQIHIWGVLFELDSIDAAGSIPVFNQITNQTNGKAYQADEGNLDDVYQRILEEF